MRTICVDYLRSILSYDPETGRLEWKHRNDVAKQINSRMAGKEAFTYCDSIGYKQGRINGLGFSAHRVAWAIYYGEWPKDQIDHIDMDKSNNKINNLRQANNSENSINRGIQSNNTSGYRGVVWHKKSGKWWARIKKDGKYISLGLYVDKVSAHDAYVRASKQIHKEFSRFV